MSEWFQAHQGVLEVLLGLSIATFVLSLIIIPILVARMPATYFLHREPPPGSWRSQHAVLRLVMVILKNLFGWLLVAAGIAMLVLPGQGVITILLGFSLVNFPGKRTLEIFIVQQPPVLKTINWMRTKARQLPLQLPSLQAGEGKRP